MCKNCIHEKVCLHKVNTQNDTYAYMGVKYDTKKCEFFKNTADVVEVVRCKDCVAKKGNAEPYECTRNNMIVYGNCYCAFGIRTPKERGGE